MITCRKCQARFRNPGRRGRPPSVCDACKQGRRVAVERAVEQPGRYVTVPEPSLPAGDTTIPTNGSSGPHVPLRAGKKASRPYISGFCGERHAPDIHRLCSGINECACGCHKKAS